MFITAPDYFTPGIWKYLYYVADERLKHNKTKFHNSSHGPEIEVIGAAAEMAARRYLGLGTTLHLYFDNGIDFWYRGRSIDVKGTKGIGPRLSYLNLQWPHFKEVKSEIAVSVGVDLQEKATVIIGWIYASLVTEKDINWEADTPCREVPYRFHNDIATLKDIPWKNRSHKEPRANQLSSRQ